MGMRPAKYDLTAHPSFLLSQLGFHVATQFTQRLKPLGINPRQYGVLTHVANHEGLSQQELAESLSIPPNAMVALVDDLESQRLAERRRDPDDRRAYAVLVSNKGLALLEQARDIVDGLDAELLGHLSSDSRRSLVRTLRDLAVGVGLPVGVHPGLRNIERSRNVGDSRSRPRK